MAGLSNNMIHNIIINEYPNSNNKILASKLGIAESTLRSKASQLGIGKSEEYMKAYYSRLQENRRLKLEESYKDYNMTKIERNIIIGSLLGDGTLSRYGRSRNACYRENTGSQQISYRKWKADKLSSLDFKINNRGGIYSPSHPLYSELYELFYPENVKIIPIDGLKMLNHPIGLACLYMDDGSLVINNYKKTNNITLFPQITLASQSFSYEENIMLADHIYDSFGIKFKLSKIRDGSKYMLKVNERNEVYKLLDIVSPYVSEISEMKYKIEVEEKLKTTRMDYIYKYPDRIIKISDPMAMDNTYSLEDEDKIIRMISEGFTYMDIAEEIRRPYYGVCDKVRRMRKVGRLTAD